MTPPHRPPPPSTSPRRSPRLSQSSAARDLRNLPLSAKTDRRTAHSRSVSGDEHRRGPSRSWRSSSDHGRSGKGRRSRSREPTPPQLMNFSIDDFTVVSHTTDSFTFTSAHPFFPGWVRVVGAHRSYRVGGTPCAHNPEEELRAKRRVRRDVEPLEVRRFLRQELLRKVGHSWWNRPRVYRHDLADERESTPSVRSVVVIPSDPEQPEVSPEQQGPGPSGSNDTGRAGCVPDHVIALHFLLPGDAEESLGTREELVAAATLEPEMGRLSVAAAIRPIKDRAVASSSSATEPITQEMVAEACDTLIREKHPASPPVWPEGSKPPTGIGREGPELSRNLLSRDARRRRRQTRARRVPDGSRAGARTGYVQSESSRQARKTAILAYPRSRDRGVRERRGRRTRGQARPEGGSTPLGGATPFRPKGRQRRSGTRTRRGHGAEPSAPLELAILNWLDISSLPALRDLSTGARTTVNIPWPPAGMERFNPEWRQSDGTPPGSM